jgi:hypothetical protein
MAQWDTIPRDAGAAAYDDARVVNDNNTTGALTTNSHAIVLPKNISHPLSFFFLLCNDLIWV